MTFRPFEGNQNPLPWLQRASETNHDEQEEPTPAAALPQALPENDNDGTASEPPEAEESPTGTPGDADTPLSSGEDPEAKLPVGAQSGIQPTLDSGHADNGATAILATAPQDTSTRFRLSDILREAAAQETVTGNPPAVRRVDIASPVPEITPHVVAASTAAAPRTVGEADYPTLLERPRDGKTEPFLDMMPEAMADDVDQDFKELESLPKARDPLAAAGPAPYIAPPPTRERRFQSQAAGRVPWRVVSALALALALAGFIGAFTGWVLTSEDSAREVNRRIAAELTEIDRYLATNQEAIATAEPNEAGRIVLPNYPLPVTISVEEAALPADELREVILDDAAALMYSDGVEAYGADSSIFDDFSTPGLVRFGIQMTQESTHEAFLVLTVLAAVATLAAAAALFFTASDARLLFFGGAVALGGGIALVGSLIMRLVFDRAASREGDNLASGLGDIAEDVSFLFTRNSLVFLAVGLVILTGGFILARLDRHSETAEARREPINIS